MRNEWTFVISSTLYLLPDEQPLAWNDELFQTFSRFKQTTAVFFQILTSIYFNIWNVRSAFELPEKDIYRVGVQRVDSAIHRIVL
jgi:hypothetical protein